MSLFPAFVARVPTFRSSIKTLPVPMTLPSNPSDCLLSIHPLCFLPPSFLSFSPKASWASSLWHFPNQTLLSAALLIVRLRGEDRSKIPRGEKIADKMGGLLWLEEDRPKLFVVGVLEGIRKAGLGLKSDAIPGRRDVDLESLIGSIGPRNDRELWG